MIEIKNLSKKYSGEYALQNINMNIPEGEIIGLFGENGAGKTTFIKSVLGLIRHDGEVMIDGHKLKREDLRKVAFATAEHSFFPELTAEDHRSFYRDNFGDFNDKRFEGLMKFFELPLNKRIRNFSTGQKNQFEVIMALSQGAKYIFMDEPFTGNDIFNREDFYKVLIGILEPDETVLISTHLIDEISNFIGRAVLIHKGEIIADVSMEELDEEGRDLTSYIKEKFDYRKDRVAEVLGEITQEV